MEIQTDKTFTEAVCELQSLDKQYWKSNKRTETLSRQVLKSPIIVVYLDDQEDAYILSASSTRPHGKRFVVTLEVNYIGHQDLSEVAIKDFALGTKYIKSKATTDTLGKQRWELFRVVSTAAFALPITEGWPRPEALDSTRVLELGMRVEYKAVRVGFSTSKPRFKWCFDGFGF